MHVSPKNRDMNTILTVAGYLAGSAVLQMVGFYCYSTFHKRKLLKSVSFDVLHEDAPSNRQSIKSQVAGPNRGGKVAALHPNISNHSSAKHSQFRSDKSLQKQLTQ